MHSHKRFLVLLSVSWSIDNCLSLMPKTWLCFLDLGCNLYHRALLYEYFKDRFLESHIVIHKEAVCGRLCVVIYSWRIMTEFIICIVCNNAAENYRLDITYENNLIIKLVLVSSQICSYCCIIYMSIMFKMCHLSVNDYTRWWYDCTG